MYLLSYACMTEEQNTIENPENEAVNNDNAGADNQQVTEPSEIETLKAQVQEANDKFLRLYAEFDNYKRRTMQERALLLQTAGKDVMLALLPVIDNFERAQKAADSTSDLEAYKEGVKLIHHQFSSILDARGLKAIDSIGGDFNVDLHEAITNIPAPSEELKGKVIDETEKGYTLNGHVIRFAKVIVGE